MENLIFSLGQVLLFGLEICACMILLIIFLILLGSICNAIYSVFFKDGE